MFDEVYQIYEGTVFRPPSEARSLILQATIGCSHNRCTFCISYRDKKFRIKSFEEVKQDVENVLPYYKNTKRIFLADGNALKIPTNDLSKILHLLEDNFPKLERVGIYACPHDVLKKSVSELKELKKAGLGIIYIGLESGSDFILKKVRKGALSKQMIEAVGKVKEADILLSVIFILGLGGKKLSEEHAKETAKVLSEMDPDYAGALTLMVVKGTEIYDEVKNGELELLDPRGVFQELRILIQNMNLSHCVFRANHASNYLPVGGTFPEDKKNILDRIDRILKKKDVSFKPEWLRAL
ncbi:MAG: radical SAM protein [Methanomassiliicoccales archaeon]|nr:MAG: radical SAM protein [Methanomassiliicoccales archaeon]